MIRRSFLSLLLSSFTTPLFSCNVSQQNIVAKFKGLDIVNSNDIFDEWKLNSCGFKEREGFAWVLKEDLYFLPGTMTFLDYNKINLWEYRYWCKLWQMELGEIIYTKLQELYK